MLSIKLDDLRPLEVKTKTFNGGEVQVRLEEDESDIVPYMAAITANINSSGMLMAVLLTTDAIRRRYGNIKIKLICPYLPYARQDRVCYPGEALSIRVLTDLINSQNYDSVEIWDVHSDVSLALLDRYEHVPASAFMHAIDTSNVVMVAPDHGAIKRATLCAKAANVPLVLADKVRDPNDGKITGTTVASEHIGDKDFLMIDDIADGGRTFIELAKVLRPLTNGKVMLYVTHGIFSQDFYVFKDIIDHIYVANLFEPYCRPDRKPDFVTVL